MNTSPGTGAAMTSSSLFQAGFRLFAALVCAGIFLTIFFPLFAAVFPPLTKVRMTVQFDQTGEVQLFYWNGMRKPVFQEKYSERAQPVPGGEKHSVTLLLSGEGVRKIRLDLGNAEGRTKLYDMTLYSFFNDPVVLTAEQIYGAFEPGNEMVSMEMAGSFVEVISSGDDPYIVSRGAPVGVTPIVGLGLPLLASLFVFLLIYRTDWSHFPAVADVLRKKPYSGENINSLDGLRGLGVLMVVGDHTWGMLTGMGAGGVWIFMTLSGFLLTRPFVSQPARAASATVMLGFYIRRLRRILPAYYCYITVIFLVTKHFDQALRHFFFLEGAGHLWVLPQEMLFYLFTPIVLFVNWLFFRGKPWWCTFFVAVLAVMAHWLLTTSVLSLRGAANGDLPLYAGIFLSGVAIAYLFEGISGSAAKMKLNREKWQRFFSRTGLLLLLLYLAFCTARPWGGERVLSQLFYEVYGVAAALLILCSVCARDSLFNNILSSLPLRAIGLVSFSLYLIHPIVLLLLQKSILHYTGYCLSGPLLFMLTLLVSYVCACATYSYIERPFMG